MTWTTGQKPNVAEACDYCTAGKATIIISDEIFGVIRKLCDEVVTEWQMLLTGTEEDDNVVRVTGYYVPEQKVTSASVKMNECMDLERVTEMGIVATIHSHSSMQVFFSGTDYTETNTSFIKNHIVVNNKQDFIATKAIELPCGMKKFIDAIVTRDLPTIVTANSVEGMDKIEKFTYTPPAYAKGGKYSGLYADSWDHEMLGESYISNKKTRKRHSWQMEGIDYE